LNKKTLSILIISILLLLVLSGIVVFYLIGQNNPKTIRVACVGDSLTQYSEYTYDLTNKLDDTYLVHNFGLSATTVTLASETPYMETTEFQAALDFKPDIVIIMLGTNDAQPCLFQFHDTFVNDYMTLVQAFQNLPSHPKIWIVLSPPIFSDRNGTISPKYFEQVILPGIKQVGKEAKLPVVDVYSLLIDHPEYFPDGIHPTMTTGKRGNEPAAQIIATAIHKAITSK
jgi:alpha-L-fucosidase 2